MLIDLMRLIINKLEKNYVNVERERESKTTFWVKEYKEKKIQKDRQQKIVKTLNEEVYNSFYEKVYIKTFT